MYGGLTGGGGGEQARSACCCYMDRERGVKRGVTDLPVVVHGVEEGMEGGAARAREDDGVDEVRRLSRRC